MSPFSMIHSLIKFAFYVGIAGGLVDMTIAMGKKAEHAKRTGFISFVELNRSLHQSKK